MSPLLFNRRFRRICMIAGLVLLLPAGTLAQSRRNSAAQLADKSSPQSTLDLALYYYNNDDLNDRAELLLKRLLTKPYEGTPQSEAAQYYLGAYHQRRFYLSRDKRGEPDWNALKQAAVEYRNYTDKYYSAGTHKWLNDSFFSLAIVQLQLGDSWSAVNELSKMKNAAERDPVVFIYQIVWSPQSQDVIDSSLPAAQLADYATKVVQENGKNFDRAVLLIQKWSQGKRAKTFQATSN